MKIVQKIILLGLFLLHSTESNAYISPKTLYLKSTAYVQSLFNKPYVKPVLITATCLGLSALVAKKLFTKKTLETPKPKIMQESDMQTDLIMCDAKAQTEPSVLKKNIEWKAVKLNFYCNDYCKSQSSPFINIDDNKTVLDDVIAESEEFLIKKSDWDALDTSGKYSFFDISLRGISLFNRNDQKIKFKNIKNNTFQNRFESPVFKFLALRRFNLSKVSDNVMEVRDSKDLKTTKKEGNDCEKK